MINGITLKLAARQPPPQLLMEANAVFERAFAEQLWEIATILVTSDNGGWYQAEVSARPKVDPDALRFQLPADGDTT